MVPQSGLRDSVCGPGGTKKNSHQRDEGTKKNSHQRDEGMKCSQLAA